MVTCSRSPSQNGSILSNGSGKPSSSRSSLQKVMAPQKAAKDEGRKRNGEKCSLCSLPLPCPHTTRDTETKFLYPQQSLRVLCGSFVGFSPSPLLLQLFLQIPWNIMVFALCVGLCKFSCFFSPPFSFFLKYQ